MEFVVFLLSVGMSIGFCGLVMSVVIRVMEIIL